MPDDVISAYDEAWNAADAATRARLIERSLTPDAELIDPAAGRVRGRDAIGERIGGFGARFPGASLTISSDVDEHNGFARYAWTIRDAEGKTLREGIDVVARADGGRLRRIVVFFDPQSCERRSAKAAGAPSARSRKWDAGR